MLILYNKLSVGTMSYGCQQILIIPDRELRSLLEYVCTTANSLINCGIYYSRQIYFQTGRFPSQADLHKQIGTIQKNKHYQALYSDTAQQILTGVAESFKSYIGLVKGIKKCTVTQKPRLPNYRTPGGLALATFTGRSLKLKNGMLRFPLGSLVKTWFGVDAFYLPMPSNLGFKSIREVRILPRNRCFYAEFIYEKIDSVAAELDKSKVLGIDPGLNNWLTGVSNVGTSFLDNDILPKFGEKPEGWKSSGIRTNRGLFKSSTGIKINADCNGAANIIRKVAMMAKFDLARISRGCLSQPKKVLLWTLQKSPGLQIGES